jgi:hypothetical protein
VEGVRLEEKELSPMTYTGVIQLPPQRPLFIRFDDIRVQTAATLKLDSHPLGEYRHYLVPEPDALPNLQLLLSPNAKGFALTIDLPGGVHPSVALGEFTWNWRLGLDRWRLLFQ